MTFSVRAKHTQVVDGDTLKVTCFLGFGVTFDTTIRLVGVDTHETYGTPHDSEEYKRGVKEKEFVQSWLRATNSEQYPLRLEIRGKGKFGRHLAEVYYNGTCLNDELVENFDIEY